MVADVEISRGVCGEPAVVSGVLARNAAPPEKPLRIVDHVMSSVTTPNPVGGSVVLLNVVV